MNKEYKKEYTNNYRNKIRREVYSILGDQCAKCSSKENLQIDHIDPKRKSFTIASNWTRKREILLEEIRKCQLLCYSCHRQKTSTEEIKPPWNKGQWKHGTRTGYDSKKCRCDLCKKAKSFYRKKGIMPQRLRGSGCKPD